LDARKLLLDASTKRTRLRQPRRTKTLSVLRELPARCARIGVVFVVFVSFSDPVLLLLTLDPVLLLTLPVLLLILLPLVVLAPAVASTKKQMLRKTNTANFMLKRFGRLSLSATAAGF